ncbi:hypothetical protein FHX44_117125 [Pseudonocardia hierapolitana]|uniref:Transcriptional regulator, AbiEi antitoxin, Type IV TA system n=1 Tax=Pseudonocardia hierapolitana TaxID=1128676 RepID=A0A561T253_9PSEU|nr:hypothetical protein [Pseudonocardia hierapolitana]TWF81182.1 hypothetical protein FHX44_117125 [Pseudonocardia hierapolitana]
MATPTQRPLHLRPHLLARGYSSDEVQRARRTGDLVTVRRGAYLGRGDERLHIPIARHAVLVHATLPTLAPGAVISHVSAAVLHGLDVWAIPLDHVHVTRPDASGGRVGSTVHRHVAPLDATEIITSPDGILVTSLLRTVVDIARTVPFEQAVVVADSALETDPTLTPAALAAALRRATGWPGVPAARRAIAFARHGAKSPGESRSRIAIARAGLPVPQLQFPVQLAGGVAVTDFGWADHRAVGEFDGVVKYGRLVPPGQTPGDVVFAEKIREDAVRAQDYGFARWIWDELDDFAPVAERIAKAFRSPSHIPPPRAHPIDR